MNVQNIAALAHAINAAYCAAIGDDTQTDWDNAPEWQKASAIAGVEMHLANPDATPEQSHESWLEQKLNEGWVYGEVKDTEAKVHPCCLPYDELPIEQKAKDYIFRATVHAASTLIESMPKPQSQVAPQAKLGFKGIGVKYIGMREEWADHLYSTGLHFVKGQVHEVPVHLAKKLLSHADVFEQVELEAVEQDTGAKAAIEDALDKAAHEKAVADEQHEVLHEVSKMNKDALIEFAQVRYNTKLDGRTKVADLRTEVNRLVEQYGVV